MNKNQIQNLKVIGKLGEGTFGIVYMVIDI